MPHGENWVRTGIRLHAGYEHFHRANPAGFSPGMKVLVPGRHQANHLVDDGLVINIPELMMYQWKNGTVVDWYPVSVGMVASRWYTSTGELRIICKVDNPTWYIPPWDGGGTLPPGPDNPIGDRWMGLSRKGAGIHGTNDITSIGRNVSHGCIRMFPPHVHKLFEEAWIGMPVIITYDSITLGLQNGIIYFSVIPDVYHTGSNDFTSVRAYLNHYGLGSVISDDELHLRLNQADGVARPLLGSATIVRVNGDIVETPIGPTWRNDKCYLPLQNFCRVIGVNADENKRNGIVTLSLRNNITVFSLTNTSSFQALGSTFVQVRALVESMGGRVAFSENTLKITM